MKLLLVSNGGRPYLAHCIDALVGFLGESRRVGFITAATLASEEAYFELARATLELKGFSLAHIGWCQDPKEMHDALRDSEAIVVGGGNTYALISRLRRREMLHAIGLKVRNGMPYIGISAGINIVGPNILTTNDWNVVGAREFDALALTACNFNPHYLEPGGYPLKGGETRDQRIAEYHTLHENPVCAVEEGAMVHIEGAVAMVCGRGRVRLFERGREPQWYTPGEALPGIVLQ